MPACSCKDHGEFSKGRTVKVHRLSNKKHPCFCYYLPHRQWAPYKKLCVFVHACADYATKKVNDTVPSQEDELVKQVVNIIKTNNISDNNINKILEAIGTREKANVKQDFNENISLQYKDVEFLKACDIDTWIQERDTVITSFVFSLCERDLSAMSPAENTKVVYAVEHLYRLVGNNIIMLFSFSLNLLTYYMCTSRTVCDMYCSAHPAGSYSTLQNWIQQHSSNKIYVRNVDVITYFDNNQVLARNGRVRYDAKAILNYITTACGTLFSQTYHKFADLSGLFSKTLVV